MSPGAFCSSLVLFDEAPTDEGAGEQEECLMEVGAAFVADLEAPEAIEPGKGSGVSLP
jgi:hypothetical protein